MWRTVGEIVRGGLCAELREFVRYCLQKFVASVKFAGLSHVLNLSFVAVCQPADGESDMVLGN